MSCLLYIICGINLCKWYILLLNEMIYLFIIYLFGWDKKLVVFIDGLLNYE